MFAAAGQQYLRQLAQMAAGIAHSPTLTYYNGRCPMSSDIFSSGLRVCHYCTEYSAVDAGILR